MIIGIVGQNGSGKDTVAEYLQSKGFNHISISNGLREEAARRGIEPTKDNLITLGNQLRNEYGNFILAKIALDKTEAGKDYVVTSIRNPGEIEELKKSGSFTLLNVEAPLNLRFERMRTRNRQGDPLSYEQFLEIERRENTNQSNTTNIKACQDMANFTIINNGTLEELNNMISQVLEKAKPKYQRPSWDEYFMELTRGVARRATCDRGRSGCVIVKDKRVLTTGYVGSPPGLVHCDEAGHLFETRYDKDGKASQHCIRTTHAEQNAIAQAAKHGISLDGATVYCKMEPCIMCAKSIIGVGIKRVVCEKRYHAAQITRDMFRDAGIQLEVINDELEKYEKQ